GTGGATGGSGGATGGTGGATGGSGGATGGTGGATGGSGGATGGTGGATGGSGGATGGTGGATGGTGGATGGTGGTGGATGGTAGTGGAKDGGTAGTGGTGGAAGTGGAGGTGGTGTTDGGGTMGTSKCGAPLFGNDPTESSINMDGPLTVAASYTAGLPTSADYKTLTIYYPSNGTGPYVMIAYAMGLTESSNLFGGWAKRMASYGYVVGLVDPNDTNNAGEDRAKGQWSALQNMKAENTRSGSPLNGKLSDCFVVSGHSLGGGASVKAANDHPADIKGVIGLNPYVQNAFAAIVAPTLLITGQNDTTAAPAQHGKKAYDGIPASTIKQYVEISGGNHQSALSVNSTTSRYAVAWMKYEVDGDTRYKALLDKLASGLSDFQTTVK
ncbi:MAG: alpha/beta hydrolase, partial [Polyangiaceae bacterium]